MLQVLFGKKIEKINYNTNIILNNLKKLYLDKIICNHVIIDNLHLKFQDYLFSITTDIVSKEIGRSSYNFTNLDFKDGDICVDIGANIGITSIYLAKKYPFLKIIAFEPVKENFSNFVKNIEINNIPAGTITPINMGVSGNGREITILTNTINTGGSTIKEINEYDGTDFVNVSKTITLDNIFEKFKIKKAKLLKIDCEGCEYEIFYNSNKETLRKIINIRGEFHMNRNIKDMGYSIKKLESFCKQYVDNVSIDRCKNM